MIEWDRLDAKAWRERYNNVRRANLLQSPDYARAVCPFYGQKARQGVILIEGTEAGLVQIQEAGLFNHAIHAVILDRGPLWFDGFGSLADNEAFFSAFAALFPARIGRRRRIIPEIEDSQQVQQVMQRLAYRRTPFPGYQTSWLDLTAPEDVLRRGLKQKWRNLLNKAEKQGLVPEWDASAENLPWLLTNYQCDRAKKEYAGPSVKLLKALAQSFSSGGNLVIGKAKLENDAVAAILLLCHGRSATYQVGWTSEAGRTAAAHNFLLWQAVLYLKSKGIRDFDLGGMNDESAKGVKKFKEGLGGHPVTLAGQYR